jgi:hypothetical protein
MVDADLVTGTGAGAIGWAVWGAGVCSFPWAGGFGWNALKELSRLQPVVWSALSR